MTTGQANPNQALLEKGDFDYAVQLSRDVLALDPDDAVAQNNLGYGLLQKGQLDEAIAHCQKAVELRPGLAAARERLATLTAARERNNGR